MPNIDFVYADILKISSQKNWTIVLFGERERKKYRWNASKFNCCVGVERIIRIISLICCDVGNRLVENVHAFNSTFQTVLNRIVVSNVWAESHRQTAPSAAHTTEKLAATQPRTAFWFVCIMMKHTSAPYSIECVFFLAVLPSLLAFALSFSLFLFLSPDTNSLCTLYNNHKINIIWLSFFCQPKHLSLTNAAAFRRSVQTCMCTSWAHHFKLCTFSLKSCECTLISIRETRVLKADTQIQLGVACEWMTAHWKTESQHDITTKAVCLIFVCNSACVFDTSYKKAHSEHGNSIAGALLLSGSHLGSALSFIVQSRMHCTHLMVK